MQESGSYQLIVRRGPQPNQTFPLNKDILSLGRDITNDIVINDPEVSRHHLRLTKGPDGFNIEDLGSTNGTFINGQRLTGVRALNRGDMIGLGETVTLGYDIVRAAGEGTPPPPAAAQPDEQRYQPPAQQQPQYQQPAPQSAPQPQPAQPQPQYQQPEYQQGYDYTPAQQPDYGYGGAPPSYDYDPYAIREQQPRSALSWVGIGCLVLSVFCCCSSIVGLVIIDALQLWYDLPIIRNIAPLFERIAGSFGLI